MGKEIRCDKCDREFKDEEVIDHPGKAYVYKDKVYCEDCLVQQGVVPDTATPYAVYIAENTDLGKLGPGAGGVL